jgi:hypothetical protein
MIIAPQVEMDAPELPPKIRRSPDRYSNMVHDLEPLYGIEP